MRPASTAGWPAPKRRAFTASRRESSPVTGVGFSKARLPWPKHRPAGPPVQRRTPAIAPRRNEAPPARISRGPPSSSARQNAGACSLLDMLQGRSKEASVPRIRRIAAAAFAASLMLVTPSAAETVDVTFLLVNDVDQMAEVDGRGGYPRIVAAIEA